MTNLPDPADLDLRPLPGSERRPVQGPVAAPAAVPDDSRVEVTLVLRRRAGAPDPTGPSLSKAELAEQFGAAPVDVDLVTSTLTKLGAEVLDTDPATRRVRVAGPDPP